MASTYLTRNTGQAGTSGKKFTISFWMKCTDVSNSITMFGASSNATGSPFMLIQRTNGGGLRFSDYTNDTTTRADKTTTRLLRDPSAFYHIVIAVDTDQSTASERNRIYINGVEETSFASDTNYSSGATTSMGQNNEMVIGRYEPYNSNYFDGIITHFHYADGQQYAPTVFGETDATTGEWKIKTDVTATYGTNGFFILKDGNSVTDQSGNSNNFTVAGGTLTNTEDNPSNVFATLNPLYNQTGGQGVVLLNGNTRSSYNSDSSRSSFGTIAVGTGKYYFEAKLESVGTAPVVGVVDLNWSNLNGASGYAFHDDALNFGYSSSGVKTSGGVSTAYGDTFTAGDIIGVAIDKTNNKLYFAKNGVWQNSGDPTSGATGTGSAFNLASDTLYTSACRIRNGGDWSFNFGQGYFGTTAVASAGTSPSGGGIFEFDCPSGYQSLSTKGINSF
jgi:hypothetical protein